MIITTKIKTDFVLQGPGEQVHAVQDDKYSRNLEISLFAGGVAVAPEGDVSVLVRYVKPDGTGGEYDTLPDGTAACSLNGNVLTVALAPQVLTVAGRVRLSVALISAAAELHTFSIPVHVAANPKLQATSEDYYKVTGILASSGWTPNAIMGTDDQGRVCIIETDVTLTMRGMPADSEAVGLAIGQIGDALDAINGRVV